MSVEVIEIGGRDFGVGYTEGTGKRTYLVRCIGESDEISAITLAVAAEAPFYWNNMTRQEFQTTSKNGDIYTVEVPYKYAARTGGGDGAGSGTLVGVAPDPTQPPTPGSGPGGGDPSPPPVGPASENDRLTPNVSLEIGTRPGKLFTSQETIATAAASGFTAPNYHGAIQVDKDGKVEGCDLPEPPIVLTQDFTFDFVTWKFVDRLTALCWLTNDRPWSTFPADQVTLMGASLKPDNQGRVVVTLKFGLYPPLEILAGSIRRLADGTPDLPLSDIRGPGSCYVWVRFGTEKDAASNVAVERPQCLYVERLLKRADFRLLGIGG